MSFLRVILTDLKRSIFSLRFLFVVLLIPLLYIFSGMHGELQFTALTDVASELDYLSNVGAYSSLLVLSSVFPFGFAFCIDWKQKSYYLYMARSGKTYYTASKIIACAVSGGLSVALGVAIFIGILSCFLPIGIPNSGYGNSSAFIVQKSLETGKLGTDFLAGVFTNGQYFLFFIGKLYCVFLICAFWAAVSMCISAVIPNSFVIFFMPYILSNFESAAKNTFHYIFPKTTNLMWGNFCFGNGALSSIVIFTVAFACLITLLAMLFDFLVKRRIAYANV